MDYLILIGGVAVVGVLAAAWVFMRRDNAAPDFGVPFEAMSGDDAAVEELAVRAGWRCELRPAPRIRYRLSGASERGVNWQLAHVGADKDGSGLPVLVWSTDNVTFPRLMLELLPTPLYAALKGKADRGEDDPALSRSRTALLRDGVRVALTKAELNERFILVSVAPTVASQLFTVEVEAAVESCGAKDLRLSLGFPNLRVSAQAGALSDEELRRLVEAGVSVAHRYLELRQSQGAV